MKPGMTKPNRGLHLLHGQVLSAESQAVLDRALERCAGSEIWRKRKAAEARDLLALAQVAPPGRMRLEGLDLSDALRSLVRLRVPAPWRDERGEVHIADEAVLGIVYPQQALFQQQPGYSFVELLLPRKVWHPSIAAMPGWPQAICLGHVPAGVRLRELVLLTYGALAMQTVQLDQFDPMGLMNPEAGASWQQRIADLPLSRQAFFDPVS